MALITTCSARTDLGRKRTLNEDSYVVRPEFSLYVVADGMGGHAAGEVASALAVETVDEFFQHTNTNDEFTWPFEIDENLPFEANKLRTAIRLANRRIHKSAMEQHLEGMGTTIVGVILVPDRDMLCIGHVGDSRAYLVRNGQLWALTTDHSWVNVQVMLGQITADEARHHPMKNIITRALGTRDDVEVDISLREVFPGDLLILCSDGLSGMVEDPDLLQIVLSRQKDLSKATEELIQRANARGGDDNITVVLVRIEAVGDSDDESTVRIVPDSTEVETQDMAQLPTVKMEQKSAEELRRGADPLLGGMDDWEADLKRPVEPLRPIKVREDDGLDF